MSGLAFFDTSILVCADDSSSLTGHLRRRTAVVSLQVLPEYFAAATRNHGLPPEIAQRKVEIPAELQSRTFLKPAGAETLYSEDFQSGAVLGGVRVLNHRFVS